MYLVCHYNNKFVSKININKKIIIIKFKLIIKNNATYIKK